MKGDEVVGVWQGVSIRNESSPRIPPKPHLLLILRVFADGTYIAAQNGSGFSPAFGNWSYVGGNSFKFKSSYLVETEAKSGLVEQTIAFGEGEVAMTDDGQSLTGTYTESRTPIIDDEPQKTGKIEIAGSFRANRLSFLDAPP